MASLDRPIPPDSQPEPPARLPAQTITLGPDVKLVPLRALQEMFGVTNLTAHRFLDALVVPKIMLAGGWYFNFHSLRRAFYLLTLPGAGRGFVLPGSTNRSGPDLRRRGYRVLMDAAAYLELEKLDESHALAEALKELLTAESFTRASRKVQKLHDDQTKRAVQKVQRAVKDYDRAHPPVPAPDSLEGEPGEGQS